MSGRTGGTLCVHLLRANVQTMSTDRKGYKMKSIVLSICGLLACAAGAFPLNPSFTPEAVAAYKAKAGTGFVKEMTR